MASNGPGACCTSGLIHEGTPVGEMKNIGGVEAYIVTPKKNKNTQKAVLVLSDIFGIYTNSKLLADDYATEGYLVIVPDLFHGDAVSFSDVAAGSFNIHSWLRNHPTTKVDPIIETTINYVRQELGYKRIGAAGYCFGAKYVCRYLKDGKIDVGYNAHPSFVTHDELGNIAGPLSIAAAENDEIFTTRLRHESEAILVKSCQPWQINLLSGVVHGFAVRADLTDDHQKWAKEQAFYQAIGWFYQYL